MTERLFVYGTLMRGEGAHRLLERWKARFLGSPRTPPAYTLVEAAGGAYPALVAGGTRAIEGELFAIDAAALPALDAYEEAPAVYQRIAERFEGYGEAWVYVIRPAHAAGLPEWPRPRWTGRR